jgi:hypothetical protein
MLRITTGINYLVATLTEKCTLDNPVFLVEFINQITLQKRYCIAEDISEYPDRYNKLVIDNDPEPVDPLEGEVDLSVRGYYHYKVYEQSSTTNLDPDNAVGLVERGIAKVEYTAQTVTEYETTQNDGVYTGDPVDEFLTDEDGNYLTDEQGILLIAE